MRDKKIKVTKEQFVEVLNLWLSKHLNNEAVEKTAKDVGFKIKNDRDFNKISNELFFLNTWAVILACENEFEDENKRNQCLNMFHRTLYESLEEKEKKFSDWM